jgi:hypothetical protein
VHTVTCESHNNDERITYTTTYIFDLVSQVEQKHALDLQRPHRIVVDRLRYLLEHDLFRIEVSTLVSQNIGINIGIPFRLQLETDEWLTYQILQPAQFSTVTSYVLRQLSPRCLRCEHLKCLHLFCVLRE